MEISLRTKKIIFITINILMFLILYNIPVESNILKNLCLIKMITGKQCWNCGMTRAFLSIMHLEFQQAYCFNHNVIVVFPLTVGIYLYSCYKFIKK